MWSLYEVYLVYRKRCSFLSKVDCKDGNYPKAPRSHVDYPRLLSLAKQANGAMLHMVSAYVPYFVFFHHSVRPVQSLRSFVTIHPTIFSLGSLATVTTCYFTRYRTSFLQALSCLLTGNRDDESLVTFCTRHPIPTHFEYCRS